MARLSRQLAGKVPATSRLIAVPPPPSPRRRAARLAKRNGRARPSEPLTGVPLQERLSALRRPIRVAIIGAGSMGAGLVHQCGITPGIQCVAVGDLRVDRAAAAVTEAGGRARIVSGLSAALQAMRQGCVAVCDDGDVVARLDRVDVLIEASSSALHGGVFAQTALEHGKHLVLMNSEVDLVFGPWLAALAEQKGLIYTSTDGDQYGVIHRMVEEMRLWGFDLVMAGNIKGYLDRQAHPGMIGPEADKRRLDHRMCTSYTDGTKLNIEMALLANALDLRTVRPGMLGPRARNVQEALTLFDLPQLWKTRQPVVDYLLGAEPGGGVFTIGWCDHPYQRRMMAYYKMGDGPFYLFYRPYHLCHVEAIRSVAEAVLDRRTLMRPAAGFRTNVVAYAKTDLHRGQALDGLGGYTCYGLIENCPPGWPSNGLPICLAEHVTLRRAVPGHQRIGLADVEYDPRRSDFAMYAKAQAAGGRA